MKTKIIGLTGGIGSGKSTIAEIFKSLGVSIYNADKEAAEISNKSEVIDKIVAVFGKSVLNRDNTINRKYLGETVFKNKEKLNKLNAIIHPLVQEHFKNWYEQQNVPFIIKEAAILIETGGHKTCDKVILVTCNEDERIKRVTKRDSVSKEAVVQRIKNQLSESEKAPFADFIIKNDNETLVTPEAIAIYNKLLTL